MAKYSIDDLIKEIEQSNLQYKDIAEIAGIRDVTLWRIRTKKISPTISTARAIHDAIKKLKK